MSTYALVDDNTNIVENIIMWDGNTETWQPPVGFYTVLLENTEAGIGWSYVDGVFINPNPEPTLITPEPTE